MDIKTKNIQGDTKNVFKIFLQLSQKCGKQYWLASYIMGKIGWILSKIYEKIKVYLWNTMPPVAKKVQKAILSFKVEVKVTRSLTLVSFERASLVEYACQISEVSISYCSKVIAKVEVDNRQTNRQTNKQTNRQTDTTKTVFPWSFDLGA